MIEIANLGKRYFLTHQGRADNLKTWLKSLAKSGPAGNRKETEEEFWALKQVSAQVSSGECLALVGKNGSGKSTLLKILSRIIPPTCGTVRLQGRVAALLEVGTGFHPELTGRENIFLNGALLGCNERQMRQRFDAIVDFSGVERFLDTPVKHYSSGMYVRLAYSVAAHIDADILIIDEVLAVGDADFQRKCLAHLKAAIASGKTALIVSHNLDLLAQIATHVAWLQSGALVAVDTIDSDIMSRYASNN